MNPLDILIAIAVFSGLLAGFRRGLWLTLAQYGGMLAGTLAGVRLAPEAVEWLGVSDAIGRQVVAVLVVVVAAGVGGSIGLWLVGPVRRWLVRVPVLGVVDSLAGAAVSALATLALIWLVAITFARGPVPALAQVIQQSQIVRRLDEAAPLPPAFVARLQQILSGTFLPPVFAGLEPDLPPAARPSPDSIATEGVRAAARSTVKVQGLGCGGVATGSGFAVGNDLVVTNAHVVSGTRGTTVSTADGRNRPAEVVVFDPARDLAVLRAPGLGLTALAPDDATVGAGAAAIGYPGGGPLRVSPAVVQRRFTATGRDIFNRRLAEREVWTISADVRPGNSGGPLVDEDGEFIGVIFASSVSNPGQAYALTTAEVLPSIRAAAAERTTIDTRSFACAR